MKKSVFVAALLCCCTWITSSAHKGIMYLKSPASYQVLSISENGKWACGVQYDENADVNYGFRWNLQTGKIEMMGECTASCVSNDGTVVASYYTTDGFSDGKKHEAAAIWKDDVWTVLEQPNNYGTWAYSISPDGRHVTGTDYKYKSYIWTDGKIANRITINPIVTEANGTFITYAVSPDGTMAGGWAYYSDDNRNPGYWDAKDNKFHCLEPNQPGSPWQAVKKFSADNKKVLFWGGYHVDPKAPQKGYGMHALYNIDTKDTTYIYPVYDDPFNFDLFDMNSDASVVLGYQQDDSGLETGLIWANDTTYWAEDYLKTLGAEFSEEDIPLVTDKLHFIIRAVAVDGAAKTYAILYYDDEYEYHTMIVALDRELGNTPPVNLEAVQVTGLSSVYLKWDAPMGDKSALKGYDIYRNGVKINSETVTATEYYDKDVIIGSTYEYGIKAVYNDGESEISAVASVTIVEVGINAPTSLFARQKGYNGSLVMWNAPESNLTPCTYVDESKNMDGFGGGTVSFESGTRFSAEKMALYDGYRLTGVTFYPGTEQGSWLVNIYTRNDGVLTSLGSFKVTQPLEYGVKNTFYLPRQISLQKDHELIIGIQTNVTNPSYNVQGVFEDCMKVGYTDLIRQVGEKDFYSINEMSAAGTYDMAWGTTALLAPQGMTSAMDSIDHYVVTVDGKDFLPEGVDKVTETSFTTQSIEEGRHNVEVAVVYKDGRTSAKTAAEFTVKADDSKLKSVKATVEVDGSTIKATWDTPKDDDASEMGYCSNTPAKKAPAATESVSEFIARVDFTPAELKGYEGYEIRSVKFFPVSDNCSYEIAFYEGDNMVAGGVPEEVIGGEWNTMELSTPVVIKKNTIYRYCVDCYDCPAGAYPLAIDGDDAKTDYSSYIMSYGEEEWYTVYEETGLNGNWMMRIDVMDPNGKEFSVNSYDVYLDGEKTNVLANEYSYNYQTVDEKMHTLRVDANYPARTVEGKNVRFNLNTTGINEVNSSSTEISQVYAIDGRRMNGMQKGMNIVRMKDGKVFKTVK